MSLAALIPAVPAAPLAARLTRVERLLFGFTVVAAASIMWLAPRPPMGDLAQHAGQVALWRDLLLGQTPFAEFVHINLLTPYLIGYGLLLPLSFVFEMATTAKIILTLAFLGFVGASMLMRRALGADQRLDWLFLISFFGFAWKWGFLTFLVASPFALLALLLALRHARSPTGRNAAYLVLAGMGLLFCHGLLFLAVALFGGLMALQQAIACKGGAWPARLAPYAFLGLVLVLFRLATQQLDGAMQNEDFRYGIEIWLRPIVSIISVSDMDNMGGIWLPLATAVALFAPFYLGVQANRGPAVWLLAALVALLFVLPMQAFQTGLIYQRFTLLLPAFIAFAFRAKDTGPSGARWRWAGTAVLILACWTVLAIQASRVAAFAEEGRSFETVLKAAKPGQRALAMAFDPESPAASNGILYMHYASWYQADKHGFVDFNIADFHPQVVRFKPGKSPGINQLFGWNPAKYAFSGLDMTIYTYFFVRGSSGQVGKLKRSSPCNVQTLAEDHEWYLLEQSECRVKWPVPQN